MVVPLALSSNLHMYGKGSTILNRNLEIISYIATPIRLLHTHHRLNNVSFGVIVKPRTSERRGRCNVTTVKPQALRKAVGSGDQTAASKPTKYIIKE